MGVGLLLDTCTLLSMAKIVNKKIDKKSNELILSADPLYISPISLYEIGIKWKKGSLNLNVNPEIFWKESIKAFELTELTIDSDILSQSYNLPDHHRDPFDRIIISHAIILRIPVITFDQLFTNYNSVKYFESIICT